MFSLTLPVIVAGLLVGPVSPHPAGYLRTGKKPAVYAPREGDLIFYDDRNPAWSVLFALVGTGPPLHMGIVVKRPGGALAILEAGPDDTIWVELLPLASRLRQFERDFRGKVTVRRCKKELTLAQSRALTRFAVLQEGKRYAVLRLLAQGTPFRARGPWPVVAARTYLERDAWICSELAVAAAVVAGLTERDAVPANATYPRDLVNDRRHDLSAVWHAEAEWVSDCGRRATSGPRTAP
jgi:hypothetical protein